MLNYLPILFVCMLILKVLPVDRLSSVFLHSQDQTFLFVEIKSQQPAASNVEVPLPW